MVKKKYISVVLSFYNEENVLPELIRRLKSVFSELISADILNSYELIFVNDNSTDGSASFIESQMDVANIVLVNMSRNFGVSECALAGMSFAKGDAIIYMDADLQYPPEVIPKLISAWQDDPDVDVVYTTRINRLGEHWLKMLITKIGYRFLNFISDIELPIDSGDFKLLSKKVVNQLINFKEDRPYIRGLISWIGFKQVQVLYERDVRFDGRENTKMPVLSGKVIYYWLDRALISFSDAPLKVMLFAGLILSIISIFYVGVVILQKILGLAVPGWAAIMSAVLFLGGMQLMTLGFVGLYVGAIFRESKNRPKYIISDVKKSSNLHTLRN